MKKNWNEIADKLILSQQQQKAVELLLAEYEAAKASGNQTEVDTVLSHLIFAYCCCNPPELAKAHDFSLRREQNLDTSYNMYRTGMLLCYAANDYAGAADKLRQAVKAGIREQDDRTVYSSLGLLGFALLKQGLKEEAVAVLMEIERAIEDKRPCVIGDETNFLELADKHGLESQRVRNLAAKLAPICRDPQFARRLTALANGKS